MSCKNDVRAAPSGQSNLMQSRRARFQPVVLVVPIHGITLAFRANSR
jgi:hypothetical protein